MTAEADQTAKNPQPLELQNLTGWGTEWVAIQADSLAKAVYDFHQSRIGALTALELGVQLEAGNIDYLEFSRLMEQARRAAEAEKLPLSGEAGRTTDARGFVKDFLKKEFQRPKPERMTAEESVKRSQIAVLQTAGVILQCLEPDHELKNTQDIVELLPEAVGGLNLVGLKQVPKATEDRKNLAQELNQYVRSQAGSLGISLLKPEGRPTSGFSIDLEKVLRANLAYGVLINQPLVASLAVNADNRGAAVGLVTRALEDAITSHTEKGAGPKGQNVEEVGYGGGWPQRINKLFPGYQYAESRYWRAHLFPYDKIALPQGKYSYQDLSIYRFHIQQQLPAHILAGVAGGKLESLRALIAGPTEFFREGLARHGFVVPDLALEQDSVRLTSKLDQLRDWLRRDEEWLNIDAMLARIHHSEWKKRKPDDLDFSPHLWRLSEYKGDIRLYAPWERFGVKNGEEFDKWVEKHGETAKIFFYAEAAGKLLPKMGIAEQAEREGRITDVVGRLKMALKWPDKQLTAAIPGLGAKLEALRIKYRTGGDIPWEELVAAYQSEKPTLEAAMKSAGVDLTPRTAVDIRRAGENLTLGEAMDKQTGLRRQRLAELILLGETDTFDYDDVPFLLRLAGYELLSYHGELEPEEIPAEIVNVRGRNETVAQAREWLKTQPLQARSWISYLMLFRMFQDTLAGRLDWPPVQAEIYQEMKEMGFAGYQIPKYSRPAVGAMIERLALVEKAGLEPKDLPSVPVAMKKIGLAVSEVKYGNWWDVYQAEAVRKTYLETIDPSDVGQNTGWLKDFAEAIKPVNIKIWELLKQRYGISVS